MKNSYIYRSRAAENLGYALEVAKMFTINPNPTIMIFENVAHTVYPTSRFENIEALHKQALERKKKFKNQPDAILYDTSPGTNLEDAVEMAKLIADKKMVLMPFNGTDFHITKDTKLEDIEKEYTKSDGMDWNKWYQAASTQKSQDNVIG